MSIETTRAAQDKLASVLIAQPQKGRAKTVPATARWQEGLKVAVTGPNGEAIATDMPPGLGGTGGAPGPGWYLRAALASCTTTVIAMRAAREGIALTRLEMTVEADNDLRGLLGTDEKVSAGLFDFRSRVVISADGVAAEDLRALVQWGNAHSPVGCTLRAVLAQQIEVTVI